MLAIDALDKFFSAADQQRFKAQSAKSTKSALSKLDKVRLDHDKRIKALQLAQETSFEKVRGASSNANTTRPGLLSMDRHH